MTLSAHWDLDICALSSIVHREDYGAIGTDTFALFRREKIITPTGDVIHVPVVSGSSFRGVLRRIGEALTAAVLNYEETNLPVPAAHLLTNGGRLAKSARPITDEQERHLKALIPQIACFGGAASGRIMSGLITVGKVLPEVEELRHLLPRPPRNDAPLPAVLVTAEESFSHLADYRAVANQPSHVNLDESPEASPLGRFGVETLPAGVRLQSWVRLDHATSAQAAFFHDVLTVFASRGHLGGRIGSGHGQISATLTLSMVRGGAEHLDADWAGQLADNRDEALAALASLT